MILVENRLSEVGALEDRVQVFLFLLLTHLTLIHFDQLQRFLLGLLVLLLEFLQPVVLILPDFSFQLSSKAHQK